MQFIRNGPNIPDSLLQSHEDGKVVFFCGAGISYPADLPSFKGLVERLYNRLGYSPGPLEQRDLNANRFDSALDQLERRYPGGRTAVRPALLSSLEPNLDRPNATRTHEALVRLGRDRHGALKVVTTNFDRLFVHVTERNCETIRHFTAPQLPLAKKSRWNGLVYLHGLLPETNNAERLNDLVLTSGDFGLAYLSEGWAAEFAVNLFTNFVVCFVGYSIEDPVLRYLMDALAADRRLGEMPPQAYAFASSSPDQKTPTHEEWSAKGVVPILYEIPTDNTDDHSALHETLWAWAETYKDGIQGKERIVSETALSIPQASTDQDDFVSRLIWALSDPSGLPARRFADLDPVPSLDWLFAFDKQLFTEHDLPLFGVIPTPDERHPAPFSLIDRPCPYKLAPRMRLAAAAHESSSLDPVLHHLSRWISRHLNDPALALWLANQGGKLHPVLANQIQWALDHITDLEIDDRLGDIEAMRAAAPNSIPDMRMRAVWGLFLRGRVVSSLQNLNAITWRRRFEREGLTFSLRDEFMEMLSPRLQIERSISSFNFSSDGVTDETPKPAIDFRPCLSTDDVMSLLTDLPETEAWRTVLISMLPTLQSLLHDSLDMQASVEIAGHRGDRSSWDIPSIEDHWQNRDHHHRDWTILIRLLRDAWIGVCAHDSQRAASIAREWQSIGYPTFKRLAYFAASRAESIENAEWVNWLLADEAWWLWAQDTLRETMRLLAKRAQHLGQADRGHIEAAILLGPPRQMYVEDLSEEDWDNIVQKETFKRLGQLERFAAPLGEAAATNLEAIRTKFPDWQFADDEREEFSIWTYGTGDPGFESEFTRERAPRNFDRLVEWLQRPVAKRHDWRDDDWRDICKEDPPRSFTALKHLAAEGEWPETRWETALYAWGDREHAAAAWEEMADTIVSMPAPCLEYVNHALSFWLTDVARAVKERTATFIGICERILDLEIGYGQENRNAVTAAINHSIGKTVEALIILWESRGLTTGQGLPDDLRPVFTCVSKADEPRFCHGRVVLASNLARLFVVDPEWTRENLLSRLRWECDPEEASRMWQGFMRAPRLVTPLIEEIEPDFLETASRVTALENLGKTYVQFLTFAALDPISSDKAPAYRQAFSHLPADALPQAALAMNNALSGAGEQRHDYWVNHVLPFWQNIWPQQNELRSPELSEQLAQICVSAGEDFPDAVRLFNGWFMPVRFSGLVLKKLGEENLATAFPQETLTLLASIIGDSLWYSSDLTHCLDIIEDTSPQLAGDSDLIRLRTMVRKYS